MAYATPLSLLRFGADALAQLCSAQLGKTLDPLLLELAIDEADLSNYPADDQALVADAIAWIDGRITAAEKLINGYLAKYTLPLTQTQIDDSALPGYAEVIAYHQMMINGPDDITKNRYAEAIAWLKDVSRGLARIGGAADTEAVTTDQRRLTCAAPSGIDWSNY